MLDTFQIHDITDDGSYLSDLGRPESAKVGRLAAVAEAEARREAAAGTVLPKELGGRVNGLEPVRYGDWEKKGVAVDF